MALIGKWVFPPITVLLLVLSFWEPARRRVLAGRGVQRLEKRLTLSNKGYWAAFGLILAAGAFVRCYRFLELPLGQNQDGTMAAVEAFCLSSGGTDQFGTSWPTYFEAWGYSQMSTLYSYLLIPFIKVFGLSKFTLRLPMLLMGLAALPLMWDAARRIGGKNFALLALFLLALNPWHIVLSRWALEANMLPHVLLLAVELLLVGMRRRWALYLSMVFFGLAPYAYGLAAVSVPCILLPAAVFLAARKKVKPLDLAVCVVIFAAVSGPYYMTMIINAFGLDTMTLGKMTMPRFAQSKRSNDISLGAENPYLSMAQKLRDFLPVATGLYPADGYSGIGWADTMYPFVIPAALYGWYRLCRDRRRLALTGREEPLRDGGMLILIWMFAAIVNTAMVGAVVNRNNILYYPWILCAAYALWQMGKRLRTALAAMLAMIAVGFAGACGVYFGDADYQQDTANNFLYGVQDALIETWDWDCDRYYLTTMSRNDGEKTMISQVMFAHQIDYAMRSEEEELRGSDGQPNGWYYTERYIYQDFADFTPDPTECAVYIVLQREKVLFDEADYLITDFGNFAAVYPRYWAE